MFFLKFKLKIFIIISLFISINFQTFSAFAIDPDYRSAAVGGLYGIGAGTLMGLVVYPLTRSKQGIVIGAAVGAVLGGAAGVYHSYNRDNPDNPLSRNAVSSLSDNYLRGSINQQTSHQQAIHLLEPAYQEIVFKNSKLENSKALIRWDVVLLQF